MASVQLESVGSREVDVARCTRERTETVHTTDVIAFVEHVVPVELQLYISHFVVERKVEQSVARIGNQLIWLASAHLSFATGYAIDAKTHT